MWFGVYYTKSLVILNNSREIIMQKLKCDLVGYYAKMLITLANCKQMSEMFYKDAGSLTTLYE